MSDVDGIAWLFGMAGDRVWRYVPVSMVEECPWEDLGCPLR